MVECPDSPYVGLLQFWDEKNPRSRGSCGDFRRGDWLQLPGDFASGFGAEQSLFNGGVLAAGHLIFGGCALGLGLLSRGLRGAASAVIFGVLRVTGIHRDREAHENA